MRKLLDLSGVAFIVVIVTAVLQLSGCGTYNSWTPREHDPVPERSCTSGYYQCKSGSMDHDKDGLR